MNDYQKNIVLEFLSKRKKHNEQIIEKLNQTIVHNTNWVLPIAEKDNNEKTLKSITEVVKNAKIVIEIKQNDLIEVNNLIDEIKRFV